MEVFFSVGEPSGDVHGANLVRELHRQRPDLKCVGYGGPRMAEAGCELHTDLTCFAVMWFARVLLNLHHFYRLMRAADRHFATARVAAVVLIDYPGFNWWIARCAKKHGIPVFYYGVPQIWAWARWRLEKMRHLVDYALCKLPFEETWYQARGCPATYVGHPFFDETERHILDETFLAECRTPQAPLVTLLPGSRTQEVLVNLPVFLQAVRKIAAHVPNAKFAIAAFNEKQSELARQALGEAELGRHAPKVAVHVDRTPELIAAADCCIACSGSVSLQLLSYETPSVIHYRVGPWAYFAQQYFRKVKYITLVNLLAADDPIPDQLDRNAMYDPDSPDADEVPFPEYLCCQDRSDVLARHIVTWLTDHEARETCLEQLRELKQQVAEGGASRRAAGFIARKLPPPREARRAA